MSRTELQPDGSTQDVPGDLPPGGRITIPSDWGEILTPEFRGRVQYRRRFGMPTGLEDSDSVYLVVEQVDYFGRVELNGHSLGELVLGDQAFRVTVQHLLAVRNQLVITVELPYETSATLNRSHRQDQPGGLIGQVWLELPATDA